MKLEDKKHTEAEYLDIWFEDRDSEYDIREKKIVKTRKSQWCFYHGEHCPKGELMILEKAIHPDSGWVSCYLCLDCADMLIDER